MTDLGFQRWSHRSDPTVPAFDDAGLRTVMDAECGLCAKGALWIARADRAGRFRIVPMQDPLGAALLRHYGMDPSDPTSWLFLEDGVAYGGAEAVMRVAAQLGGWSVLLLALRIVPRPFREWGYTRVARNRYRLAARVDMCGLPEPALQKRLLRS